MIVFPLSCLLLQLSKVRQRENLFDLSQYCFSLLKIDLLVEVASD